MTGQFARFAAGFCLATFIIDAATAAEWKRHTIDAQFRGADGVRLADVDGDGRQDVVTPWEEGGRVTVALDRGYDADPRWEIDVVGREKSVEDAVAVDLDGDGGLEVVAAAEGNALVLKVFKRNSAGDWWNDFNLGDSRGGEKYMFALPWETTKGHDLVVGGKDEGATISVWRPSGAGRTDFSQWTSEKLRDVGWTMSLIQTDMNGDGHADLLFSDRKGPHRGIYWLLGDADGLTTNENLVAGPIHEIMFLTIDDVDQDGDVDIVAAAKDAGLLIFERRDMEGSAWHVNVIPLPESAGSAKGVGLNHLGNAVEIFVSCEHSKNRCSIVRMEWPQALNVTVEQPTTVDCPAGTVGAKFDLIEMVDMDGDGDLDLLTCEERENLGVVWYERPGALVEASR